MFPCQRGPNPAWRLCANVASDLYPGHNPVSQGSAWGLGGTPALWLWPKVVRGVSVIAWGHWPASRDSGSQDASACRMWLTPLFCCRPIPTTAKRSTAVSTCTASWPTSRGSSRSMTSNSYRLGPSPRPQDRRSPSELTLLDGGGPEGGG